MFAEKLNKKQDGSVYVLEEEIEVVDGVWEGFLRHDNAVVDNIQIFTGPKLSGQRVNNYFVSVPGDRPWSRHLKIFTQAEKLYITYETPGDQVEAEDINTLQEAVTSAKTDMDQHKADLLCHFENGVIDGGTF